MRINKFEDVVAWQKAKELNTELYIVIDKSADTVFRSQILRASLSVMNNIAEGFDRGSDKELRQFLTIARGSVAEVRSMLLLAEELDKIPTPKARDLLNLSREISKMLTGFIKSITVH